MAFKTWWSMARSALTHRPGRTSRERLPASPSRRRGKLAALSTMTLLLTFWPHADMLASSPTLTVTPVSLAAGASLGVSGSGWDPGAQVDVMWSATYDTAISTGTSNQEPIGVVQANSQGNISATLPAFVPAFAMNALGGFNCPISVTSEQVYGMEESSAAYSTPPQSAPQNITIAPWLALYSAAGTASHSYSASYYAMSAGTSATLEGCMFQPNSTFAVTWPNLTVSGGTVGADGSLQTTVSVPANETPGQITVSVSDGTNTATLPVLIDDAQIHLSSSSVAPGSSFQVSGTGFTPGTSVDLSGSLGLGPSATVANDGTFSATWDVPANQATGSYYVQANASDGVQVGGQSGPTIQVSTSSGSTTDQVSFTTAPSGTILEGQPFSAQVSLLDPSTSQVDTNASDTIQLSAAWPSAGGGTLNGTLTAAAVNGVANFQNLWFSGGSGSGVMLQAQDQTQSAVQTANSASFDVAQNDPSTDTLAFSVQPPANLGLNQTFSVTVEALDATTGLVDMTNGDTVGLSVYSPAGFPAALSGTTQENLADGQATYDLLVTQGNGSGYSLSAIDATDPSVAPAQSDSFALPLVAVPTTATVSFTSQPAAAESANQTFTATVFAAVYDQSGNLYPDQEIDYDVQDSSGDTLQLKCPDGTTQYDCIAPVSGGTATLNVDVNQQAYAGTYTIGVRGYTSSGGDVGSTVLSNAFTLVSPQLLVVAQGSSLNPDLGPWGTAVPSYSNPTAVSGQSLPYYFAGVQTYFNYAPGDQVLLAGDTPSSPFCVDGDWKLLLSGPGGFSATLTGSGCGTAPVDIVAKTAGMTAGYYGAQFLLSAPTGASDYGSGDILVYDTEGTDLGFALNTLPDTFPAIQFSTSGGTLNVGASFSTVGIDVASSPFPVSGIHAEATWDPTALSVTSIQPEGSTSTGNGSGNGHVGFLVTESSPARAPNAALNVQVACLQAGIWPITLSGNWWSDTAGLAFTQPFSDTANITCQAPASPPATASVAGASIDPADGSLHVALTGSGLGTAAQAVLTDSTGAQVATATSVTGSASGATAVFTSVPGGVYTLTLSDASGTVLAQEASFDAPPALPLFTVQEVDSLGQVPGYAVTHFWRLTNVGSEDGTAVVLFMFPDYLSSEPTLDLAALPAGSSLLQHDQTVAGGTMWGEIVSVPVAAGASVDIPWTVTLDPHAVFGTTTLISSGDVLPMLDDLLGAVTDPQAQSLGLLTGAAYAGTAYGAQTASDTNGDQLSALQNVIALSSADQTAYETYMRSAYPDLAAQMYDDGLLAQTQMLESEIQGGYIPQP